MYTTVTNYSFIDAFLGSNTYKDNFSYAGLNTLYDMLTEYEDSTGEEMKLDIVTICGYYSEYSTLRDIAKDYSIMGDTVEEMEKDGEDDETIDDYIREELGNNTTFIEFNGGIIIQDF